MRIIRYLNQNAAQKFLNPSSTFCIQSHLVYQEMEASTANEGVHDPNEGDHDFVDGGSSIGNAYLLSCWSMMEVVQEKPDWRIFQGADQGVAIISTTQKVENFLMRRVHDLLGDSWTLEHRKVEY